MLLIAANSSLVIICGIGSCSTSHQKCIKLRHALFPINVMSHRAGGTHRLEASVTHWTGHCMLLRFSQPVRRGRLLRRKHISVSLCLLSPFSSTEDARTPLPLHVGNVRRTRLLSVIILVTKYLEAEDRRVFMPSSFLLLIMSRTRYRLVPALHSNLKSI